MISVKYKPSEKFCKQILIVKMVARILDLVFFKTVVENMRIYILKHCNFLIPEALLRLTRKPRNGML